MTETLPTRFWSKVNIREGCWEWTACADFQGYGRFGLVTGSHRQVKASRAAYELMFGAIPDRLFVLHSCDNPPCVRPDHLFLGTSRDNIRDMHAKGRAIFGGAKLTATQVRQLRADYAAGGCTMLALSREYDIAQATVSRIINRKHWANVA